MKTHTALTFFVEEDLPLFSGTAITVRVAVAHRKSPSRQMRMFECAICEDTGIVIASHKTKRQSFCWCKQGQTTRQTQRVKAGAE